MGLRELFHQKREHSLEPPTFQHFVFSSAPQMAAILWLCPLAVFKIQKCPAHRLNKVGNPLSKPRQLPVLFYWGLLANSDLSQPFWLQAIRYVTSQYLFNMGSSSQDDMVTPPRIGRIFYSYRCGAQFSATYNLICIIPFKRKENPKWSSRYSNYFTPLFEKHIAWECSQNGFCHPK